MLSSRRGVILKILIKDQCAKLLTLLKNLGVSTIFRDMSKKAEQMFIKFF